MLLFNIEILICDIAELCLWPWSPDWHHQPTWNNSNICQFLPMKLLGNFWSVPNWTFDIRQLCENKAEMYYHHSHCTDNFQDKNDPFPSEEQYVALSPATSSHDCFKISHKLHIRSYDHGVGGEDQRLRCNISWHWTATYKDPANSRYVYLFSNWAISRVRASVILVSQEVECYLKL